MKEGFIETRNYTKLMESFARLEDMSVTAPRIGLGYGNFGLGKTFSLERIAAKKNAILLRAAQTWSKKQLLEKLCYELALDMSGGSGRMYERVVEELRRESRVIIIDEIDALLRSDKIGVLELLRDIHDETAIILYFIGMEDANGKLKRHRHYYSRVVELVEFKAIGVDDIRKFCELSDLTIKEDVVEYFAKKYPNLRQIKVILLRLEKECMVNDITTIDMSVFKISEVEDGNKKTYTQA